MAVIESRARPTSEEFRANEKVMLDLVTQFRQIENSVCELERKSSEKFVQQGKLLPRERIALLLDPGAPFLEISSLAGYRMHDDRDGSSAGGGVIAGIGYVENTRVIVVANNSAIKGGTISPAGLNKMLRLQEICFQSRLPLVTLAESGGANLNYAADIFVEGARCFANQARLSAAGIPQLTVVHGNATAGGAYQPGLSDYLILVKNQAKMFLAGPPLLLAATGEVANDEELGGAEMHISESGTGDYLVQNDREAIAQARQVIRHMNGQTLSEKRIFHEPLYSPDELLGVIPRDNKQPYDVREIWARVGDGSEFVEFKSDFEAQTVCGHINIEGFSCGVIGNNGPITAKGAGKAVQFIHLCDQAQLPVIFFHNTTGFMVGTHSEKNGVIKQGSKMIQAVANTKVPKISFVIGGSYGAGNYAMCGRGLDPHFIFAWPNSRTAVMGGEQAGKVLRIVSEEKMRKAGQVDVAALDKIEQDTAKMLNQSSTALFGTARLWDDGLIDPRDTRRVLAFALDICRTAAKQGRTPSSFGIGRN